MNSVKYELIIFGTGNFAEIVERQLSESILMYLDNNEEKQKKQLNGVNICSPTILKEENLPQYKVLVASSYYKEISIQLTDLGLKENHDFYDAKWLFIEEYKKEKLWIHELENLKQKIEVLRNFPIPSVLENYIYQYEKLNPMDKRIYSIKNHIPIANLTEEDIAQIYSLKLKKDSFDINTKNIHFIFDNMASKSFYDYIQNQNYKQQNFFVLITNFNTLNFFEDVTDNIYRVSIFDLTRYSLNYCLIDMISRSENVYIHYLFDEICDFFENSLIQASKIYWVIWGGDLYSNLSMPIYEEKTKELFVNKTPITISENTSSKVNFIKQLNGILTGIKGEFNLVKANYETLAEHIHFSYPSFIDLNYLDKVSKEQKEPFTENINVLVGNSGTQTNNHIEVFEKLAHYLEEINQVIVPLSYGDATYIKQISEYGQRLFGDKFKPLYNFLDSSEYGKIINSCDLIFMNHRRQQAFGNIIIALYLGKEVYLSDKVTTYSTLIDWGLDVKCIENFLDDTFKKLEDYIGKNRSSVNKANFNRKILKSYIYDIDEIYQKLFG